MPTNEIRSLQIETPGPNRRSSVWDLPCQWPSPGTERICSTWGRAEGMQQQGGVFNYSLAVTVTSGHDAEIKFFGCQWTTSRKKPGRESPREKANCYAEPGLRIYYQNIVLKQVTTPHLGLLQQEGKSYLSFCLIHPLQQSVFSERETANTLWKLQETENEWVKEWVKHVR